jgi:hypothetical protein
VRYRPPRAKYESVADYLTLVGWRSDFDPVTRRGSCENPKKGLSPLQSPRRKASSRRIRLRLSYFMELRFGATSLSG